MVQLHDKKFERFITQEEIMHAINGIAVRLNDELKDAKPVFLTVLNGAFLFSAELVKRFKYECELSFIKVASYEGMQQGDISTVMGAEPKLKGRTVVIIEDIIDSGNTIEAIMQILDQEEAEIIKIATLCYKPKAYGKHYSLDYVGLEVGSEFIVGFGLDYNGLGRNLKDIYKLTKMI